MKEELITFETAKLSKEKYFVEDTYFAYSKYGLEEYAIKIYHKNVYQGPDTVYLAPTQSLLQKWLREKHGIYAYIDYANLDVIIIEYKESEGDIILKECIYEFCPDYENDSEVLDNLLREALSLIK